MTVFAEEEFTQNPEQSEYSTEEIVLQQELEEASIEELSEEKAPVLLAAEEEMEQEIVEEKKTIPSQPTGITVTSTDGGVSISWNESEGAQKYNLYWKTDSRKWSKFASTSGTAFVDKVVTNGNKYYYAVSAQNEVGESTYDTKGVSVVYLPGTKVTASIKSNGINLTWNSVSGATGYRLYWKVPGGSWKSFKDVEGTTTYLDKAVTFGETYIYVVRPYKTIGGVKYCGPWKEANTDTITYVGQPKLKTTESIDGGIKISWDKVKGAAGYNVYWKTEGGSWKQFAKTTNNYYLDKAVKERSVYYYTVRAYSPEGNVGSYDSKGIIGTYIPATKLVSAVNQADSIDLTWKSVTGATGYRLYWRYPGGTWKSFKDVTGTTTYRDKAVNFGKTYEYLVRPFVVVNGTTCLGSYNENSMITVERLSVPQMKKATSAESGILLEWSPVKDAVKYKVYWRTENSGWKKFAETKNTSYLDKAVTAGNKYYYTVAAVNANGETGWYDETGIMGVYVPSSRMTAATNSENGITLTWQKASGATGYRLYWRYPGGTWKSFKDIEGATKYMDAGVSSNKTYEYLVRPYKSIGGVKYLGYYENSYGITVLRVGTPQLISCNNETNPKGIRITWGAVAGATKYTLYWKRANETSWKQLATTSQTEYIDTGITEGVEYIYTVRAVIETENGEVQSAYSSSGISNMLSSWTLKRLQESGGSLRDAYNWSVRIPYDGSQPSSSSSSGYAIYSFKNKKGDCLGKAATFCYMARALGYEANMIQGYVPLRAGGMGIHGWVEIVDSKTGVTYICDPDFETETGYDGYFRQYGQSGTWRYTDGKILK